MTVIATLIERHGLVRHPAGGWWQSAEPLAGEHGNALVGCVVAPGFDFEDFELADGR